MITTYQIARKELAGGQEVDRNFSEIYYLPSYNDCIINFGGLPNGFAHWPLREDSSFCRP